MIKNIRIDVRPEEAGLRLDRLILGRWPDVPRALVAEAIALGAVGLNGKPALKGDKVQAGDRVAVSELTERSDVRVAPNPRLPLQVLYADEAVLAMDKPSGMPVHPLSHRETDTLANAMLARYPELAAVGDQPLMPGLVHRIDAATSGLVLAARTPAAYLCLREQFHRQTVRKLYLAVVRGGVNETGRIESQLIHRQGTQHRMEVLGDRQPPDGQRAMRAVTEFEPVRSDAAITLLRVTIFTGVTHQIRCQLASIGHPILGDDIYGPAENPPAPSRLYLHAAEIAFRHPTDDRPTTLTSPTPPEFGGVVGTKDSTS
jgi:23S rRNA pseudouridine1911/1915/1917 synthase